MAPQAVYRWVMITGWVAVAMFVAWHGGRLTALGFALVAVEYTRFGEELRHRVFGRAASLQLVVAWMAYPVCGLCLDLWLL